MTALPLQIDYEKLPSLLFDPVPFDTCIDNPEVTEDVENLSGALCSFGEPNIQLNMRPWSVDDAQWFKDNPTQEFLVRPRLEEEVDHNYFHIMQNDVLPISVVVFEVAPNIRLRLPLWNNDEALNTMDAEEIFIFAVREFSELVASITASDRGRTSQ